MAEINTKERIAIVTGSSSGIGLETALTLAENNFITYATMRNLDKSLNILEPPQRKNLSIKVLPLDVTDDISVHRATQRIVDNESRIDLLVNNAGYTQLLTKKKHFCNICSCNLTVLDYNKGELWCNRCHVSYFPDKEPVKRQSGFETPGDKKNANSCNG
jgi:NAD(P)-dependent dehydrogenase (short-subunit alcohol dehydrogenase family)